jgi:integrase/recombinase XerD
MGVSHRTLGFYAERLTKFTAQVDYQKASRHDIERFLNSIPANQYGLGTRHATYRALKTFYRWLKAEHGVNNPMERMAAPILGKPILPSLARDQVEELLQSVGNNRDKAIISLFTESGLRLSELARIRASDINWQSRTIKKNHREGPQRGFGTIWRTLRGMSQGMACGVSAKRQQHLGLELLGHH